MSGAEGNLAPIYSTTTLPFARKAGFNHLSQFKRLLGDRILAANKGIAATTSEVTLWTGQTIIRTPFRKSPGEGFVKTLIAQGVSGTPVVPIPVDSSKINEDVLIWGAPLELFCEIAMKIRDGSPFRHTFFYGLNNGYMGYLTTRAAFAEGGHEVHVSPYTEQAEDDLALSEFLCQPSRVRYLPFNSGTRSPNMMTKWLSASFQLRMAIVQRAEASRIAM